MSATLERLWYNWIMLKNRDESEGIAGWVVMGRRDGKPISKIALLERAGDTTWTARVEFPPRAHQKLDLREAIETAVAAAAARLHEAFALYPVGFDGKRGPMLDCSLVVDSQIGRAARAWERVLASVM